MNLVCFGLLFVICQPLGAPAPATFAVCPLIAPWSEDYQRRLAAELRALPEGSAIEDAIAETLSLRDQARACRAASS
jgi:hypothetical protein